MKVIRPANFVGQEAWDAIDIERINDATVRLHWTDKPYKWHVNDGPEVFAVLMGQVDMRWPRLSEQQNRIVKWIVCRGYAATRFGSSVK